MNERVRPLLARYREHCELIGRDPAARQFLLSTLLTTRYHLSSRPISSANDAFFNRLAVSCDALLELLRGADDLWKLPSGLEPGLDQLVPFSLLEIEATSAKQLAAGFRRIYKRYFQALNQPWSALVPDPSLDLDAWPEPGRILVCVGPNVGIGDELLYFELVRRLRQRYPDTPLTVSSFNTSLWEQFPARGEFAALIDHRGDQLAPFALAAKQLAEAPDSLVVFVEFASTPMYRELEQVPSLPRFVYLDSGSRVARAIDQGRGVMCETTVRTASDMYELLDKLLDAVGLTGGWATTPPALAAEGSPRVFLNPFSSKDYRALEPSWWAEALDTAAAEVEFRVEMFAGINESSRAWAREIRDRSRRMGARIELQGEDVVPSISDTIALAARSQVVFGLDTYTGHVGVLRRVPCLTMFFGSQWDLWRVPNNTALNAYIQLPPDVAGRLLARLLAPPDQVAAEVAELVRATDALHAELADTDDVAAVHDAATRIATLISSWAEREPTLASTFTDTPREFGLSALTMLRRAVEIGAPMTPAMREQLQGACNLWRGSNLHRYARFVVERAAEAAPT